MNRSLVSGDKESEVSDIDDADGLDTAARRHGDCANLREPACIKRVKEAAVARKRERAEIERQRTFPGGQRLEEDPVHAEKSSKKKGQQKFLQNYWNKGAYHQAYPLARPGHHGSAPLKAGGLADCRPRCWRRSKLFPLWCYTVLHC